MTDDERLEDHAEDVGASIDRRYEYLEHRRYRCRLTDDERRELELLDRLFGKYSGTLSAICDEIARQEKADMDADRAESEAEARLDALVEECRNIAKITWAACRTMGRIE